MNATIKPYDYTTVESIPVDDGSAMQLVLPKPGVSVVAVQVQPGLRLVKDGAWWDGHVTIDRTFVMGSSPDDIYPNDETLDFYEPVIGTTIEDEGLQATLASIMALVPRDQMMSAPSVMAKTRGVELIGFASEDGQLQTAEGVVDFAIGDAIVRSPDRPDRVWRVSRSTFEKKYDV